MSEQFVTSTTSFIDSPTSDVGICKPPISSNSSIDSGCNSSTNDSITSNYQPSSVMSINNASASSSSQQLRQDDRNRSNQLLMLPPQPNVPPPPPPAPPQLPESLYMPNEVVYDNRASIYSQLHSFANVHTSPPQIATTNSIYATYTSAKHVLNSQQQQQQQQQPSPTVNLTTSNQQGICSTKKQQSSPQQTFQQTVINQRLSTSSLESSSNSSPTQLMPMNVKAMLLHGLPSEEVLRNWLSSIKCDDQIENFMYHGYDMHLVTRMTPQDLAAIGCKSPVLRKKLLTEIRKLNLDYDIPDFDSSISLERWLDTLKLSIYYSILINEGYGTIEKVCHLTWEDLEEIGITRLGHQKRLLMAIDKLQKAVKQQEDSQNDCAIYDVHPNHRVSLNGANTEHRFGTIGRVRSGLFQTRSGANLDHRGLPIATITPALKHVNSPIISLDNNNQSQQQQVFLQLSESAQSNKNTHNGANDVVVDQQIDESSNKPQVENLNMGYLGTTMRKIPPPLPPVRTNSLKAPGLNVNNSFAPTNGSTVNNSATSFLRIPKLGTLTATTNKMLASGGHIQTLSNNSQQSMSTRSIYSPVREAPLPPTQQHVRQSVITEKIDEETVCTTGGDSGDSSQMSFGNHQLQQAGFSSSFSTATTNNMIFTSNLPQLSNPDEFPPPPPCP